MVMWRFALPDNSDGRQVYDRVVETGRARRRRRRWVALSTAAFVVAVGGLVGALTIGGGQHGERLATGGGPPSTASTALPLTTTTVLPMVTSTSTAPASSVPTTIGPVTTVARPHQTTTTTAAAASGITATNADAGRTFTVPIGSVVHVRLTGSGPNDGWKDLTADNTSVLRTDRSSNTDGVNGNSVGDFTAVAAGQSRIWTTHTCSGTACMATVWWIDVVVSAS
jgi:hypothetical protein